MKQTRKEPLLEPFLRWLRLRRVMRQIPFQSDVLDIGCGHSATFLRAISSRIHRGFGVDFKVEERQIGNIQTVRTMLSDTLPFADHSFDVVTMLAVLEHIEQEAPLLSEVYRVLKPNGILLLTVPSVWAQPVLEFLAFTLRIVDESEIRDHKRYYDRQRLHRTLIQEQGFNQFRHHYFQFGLNNFCTVVKHQSCEALIGSRGY